MTSTLFGSREVFAIEYFNVQDRPEWIHVRLWACGRWVGDFNDRVMPGSMCGTLLRLGSPRTHPKYRMPPDVEARDDESLLEAGNTAFGESFDAFCLNCYVAAPEGRIHFIWELSEFYYDLFPDYPRSIQHHSVSWDAYRASVRPFVVAMIDLGLYVVRPGVPPLSVLDSDGCPSE